jgi:hypothetical protein
MEWWGWLIIIAWCGWVTLNIRRIQKNQFSLAENQLAIAEKMEKE